MSQDPAPDDRRHAPATLRNRDPILERLRACLPPSGLVLEVASGSGEHAVHFAAGLPGIVWQPSDPDPVACRSIAAWRLSEGTANLLAPITLDAASPDSWSIESADALVCINMVHISPWAATLGLFQGAARLLTSGAPLVLYGPYRRTGHMLEPSNAAFDEDLKRRDPRWGLRLLEDALGAAADAGFTEDVVHEMPANNLVIVLRRT